MTVPSLNAPSQRSPWLAVFLLGLCFIAWFGVRFNQLYLYQIPPSQTVHPNYFTFHDMAQSWMENGKKLGEVNLSRMIINSQRSLVSDYYTRTSEKDTYCTYLSLDPGFAIIVAVARKLVTALPDSYLRVGCLQLICDGIMLFAIFLTFLRVGAIPAAAAGMIYAIHPVFAYQSVFAFQYFWEGWFLAIAFMAMIWARRFILAERRWAGILLLILAAACFGFTLWIRSTALVAALVLLLAVLTVPSLRRYYGIFFLVFSLTILPQVMRASSVMGNFALSTRMSWHTAVQGLGHFPNKYGMEDEDLYVFTKTEKDHGIAYNYCDYTKHDAAAKKEFLAMWEQDPAFVVRSLVSRIVNNLVFNYDIDFNSWDSLTLTLLGIISLLFALRRGGELLFITGIMALVYVGYCIAVGLVYFMAQPYAYVAQMAIVFMLPSFAVMMVELFGTLARHARRLITPQFWKWPEHAPMARAAFFAVTGIVLSFCVAITVPEVRAYLFPIRAYQGLWLIYNQPNLEDNEKLVKAWKESPAKQKKDFLDLAYKYVPKSEYGEAYDISRFIAEYLRVILYRDRLDSGELKVSFGHMPYLTDGVQALNAVSISILGWRQESVSLFDISNPKSWDGRMVHIKLIPTPEREGVEYQRLANEKFARFNYDVTWIGPNELIARHNGKGCDALRAAMAVFYRGYCPFDPSTGSGPLAPEKMLKSLTQGKKEG